MHTWTRKKREQQRQAVTVTRYRHPYLTQKAISTTVTSAQTIPAQTAKAIDEMLLGLIINAPYVVVRRSTHTAL
jgi:hypothetical protein